MPWNLWKDVGWPRKEESIYFRIDSLVQSGHSSKHSLKKVEGSRYSTWAESRSRHRYSHIFTREKSLDGGWPSKKPRYHGVVACLFRLSTRPTMKKSPLGPRNSHENRKCTRLIFKSSERSNSICPSARKTVAGQKVIPVFRNPPLFTSHSLTIFSYNVSSHNEWSSSGK